MKQNIIVAIVLIGVTVLAFLGYTLVPTLQDPERTVDAQAAEEVARASRLVARYSATLDRNDLLLNDLAALGVDVGLEDPEQVLDAAEEVVLAELEELVEAHGQSLAGRPAARPQELQQAAAERDQFITENEQVLADALQAAEAALRISKGDASSRDYAEGLRLKGAVLDYQGLARHRQAVAQRQRLLPLREQLAELGRRVAALQPSTSLAAESGIDEQMAQFEARAAELRTQIDKEQVDLDALDARLADLSSRLETAQQQARSARARLEQMEDEGVDLTAKDGAQQFAAEYQRVAQSYRSALREAAALQHGTYPDAEIDASGDYLRGTYRDPGTNGPPAVEYGLGRYQDLRDALALRIEGMQEELELLREAMDRSTARRADLVERENEARQEMASLRSEARTVYDSWKQIESEAEALEEDALALFEAAREASMQAVRAAGAGWQSGYIEAQVADAALDAATVYYGRFRGRLDNAGVLDTWQEPLQLAEANVEAEREAAAAAVEEGVPLVTEAIETLAQAHRKAERNWTLVAQAAEAKYLLALFGHQQYAREAIDTYREALKGREEEPFAKPIADRLNFLERRR